jgi:transposase InsO family protein
LRSKGDFVFHSSAWARKEDLHRRLTDYSAEVFAKTCKALGIKHSFTKPYRPQTDGKAERFIQTCLREWAYGRVWPTVPSAPHGCLRS